MKLQRPYVPIPIRVKVAERQFFDATGRACTEDPPGVRTPTRKRLDAALFYLSEGGTKRLELHHRPALENRERKTVTRMFRGKPREFMVFVPDANDPDYLVYIEDADHKVETYVRGQRGQLSDAGLRRKAKRMAKNRQKNKGSKHKIQGRSAWPPKGSRKLQGRGFR